MRFNQFRLQALLTLDNWGNSPPGGHTCPPDRMPQGPPNKHQPKKPAHDSVGAGVDERRGEDLYGRPRSPYPVVRTGAHGARGCMVPRERAAIKAPTPRHATPAPTGQGSFPYLSLMPTGRPRQPVRVPALHPRKMSGREGLWGITLQIDCRIQLKNFWVGGLQWLIGSKRAVLLNFMRW